MWRTLLAMSSALLLIGCTQADNTATATAADDLVVMPAENVQWADLDPEGAPGVRIAPLWGNPAEGAFGALLRLPPGFDAPLHRHTHDMRVVILSGTYIQVPEGQPEFRIGPGSYMMQPGGDYRHITRCDAAAECVFFFESEGAFDMFMVENAGN